MKLLETRLNLLADHSTSQKQTIERLEKTLADVNQQAMAQGLDPIVPKISALESASTGMHTAMRNISGLMQK